MTLIDDPTRHLFFTGKGGVGKTSLACATAIALADRGRRVLLVSTDPASNLDEVLDVILSSVPTSVPSVEGLLALNIDPEAAAREYRERAVGPYRDVLPEAAVASIEEQLSGACTTEIAAFDEFVKFLADADVTKEFDHIVFDTAPTGHTLRLLQLPAAWDSFIESNAGGSTCLGPLSGLKAQKDLYAEAIRALSDPLRTTLVLVSRPEKSALLEAERTRRELWALGVQNQFFVLNGTFIARDRDDSVAMALEEHGRVALAGMPHGLVTLPRAEVMLCPYELVGAKALRAVLAPDTVHSMPKASSVRDRGSEGLPPLASILPEIESGGHGVVMVMGKGGVGKTTIASAIAVELASRGHRVYLTTTDPAGRVQADLARRVPSLTVNSIDPAVETQAYKDEVLRTAGRALDLGAFLLLEEELRSPCTEEIAVFRAFSREVERGEDGFVILDTAPTGHTMLLLDATEAYHRQVSHTLSDLPESVRRLLPRLRDPRFTRILIATLPEATPVHEAAQLQQDLERAQMTPFAWVINQCLTPLVVKDPILKARQASEHRFIAEVRRVHATRVCLVPWLIDEPATPDSLRDIVTGHAAIAQQMPRPFR